MSILLTSLDSIDSSDVANYQEELAEIIQDKYPMLNLRQGVFRDLVSYLNAIFAAKTSTELDRYRSAQSLLKIEEDPSLADDGVVDGILSNYNVTRVEGSYSKGNIVIEYNSDSTAFIPSGFEFTASGETFYTENAITVYKSSSTKTAESNSRILHKMSDGYYGCTIPVTASSIGVSGITRGTLFTPVVSSVNIVKAYAAADFSSGKNTESNEELIQRLKTGIATPCWGSRYNIENLIRTKSTVTDLIGMSIIGFGDAEMQRDTSKLFPFSTGGKTDIYVKTSSDVTYNTVTLKAIKSEIVDGKQRWQVSVPNSTLPGFYRVTTINKPGYSEGTGYTIVSQSVISNQSDLDGKDAGYSTYQNYTVVFETDDVITNDTLMEFDVTVVGLSGIDSIQEVLGDSTYKPVTCDALAKAAVPAFVDLNIEILEDTPGTFTDELKSQIIKDVSESINNTGFNIVLTGGKIIKTIQASLGNNGTVYSLNMSAEIWGPDDVNYRTQDTMKLEIPNDPENYVTPNTTVWFARDISITLA